MTAEVASEIKTTWRCTHCRATGSIQRCTGTSSDVAVRAVLMAHGAASPKCENTEGLRFTLRQKEEGNGINSTRR